MISLPALRQSVPWHTQRAVQRWADDIFRFASRRSSYTLRIEPGEA